MLDFLPISLYSALQNINTNLLYEIRLRQGQPIVINFAGQYLYLTSCGTSLNANLALFASPQDIEECIYRASEYSIYSVTEQIQQGFITAKSGERIGLAGTYVYEENQLQNIREITSLNIRVPHSVIGAADEIMKNCFFMNRQLLNSQLSNSQFQTKQQNHTADNQIANHYAKNQQLNSTTNNPTIQNDFHNTCNMASQDMQAVCNSRQTNSAIQSMQNTNLLNIEQNHSQNRYLDGYTTHANNHFDEYQNSIQTDKSYNKIEQNKFTNRLQEIKQVQEFKITADRLPNILLCGSAGCGKTTILRDLIKQISSTAILNILLSDERNEISTVYREESATFGYGVDILRYAKKQDALKLGLRAMRPDIVVTDELITRQEVLSLLQAHYGGVKIIASVHATQIADIQNMPILIDALQSKLFDYYIFLESGTVGKIAAIYNRDLEQIPV